MQPSILKVCRDLVLSIAMIGTVPFFVSHVSAEVILEHVFFEDFEQHNAPEMPFPIVPVNGEPVRLDSPRQGTWISTSTVSNFVYNNGSSNLDPTTHSKLGGEFSGLLSDNSMIEARFSSPLNVNHEINILMDVWQRFDADLSRTLRITGHAFNDEQLFSLNVGRSGNIVFNGIQVDEPDSTGITFDDQYHVHSNYPPLSDLQDDFWNRLRLTFDGNNEIHLSTTLNATDGSVAEYNLLLDNAPFPAVPTENVSANLASLKFATTPGGKTFVDNVRVNGTQTLGVFCDFNDDASCDLADVNSFWEYWGTSNEIRDLNFDGVVTRADMDAWLVQAGYLNVGDPYQYGNSDLDLDVDTRDLNLAILNFTGPQGNNKVFGDGNTDTDGDVDTADLTRAIMNFTGAIAAGERASDTSIVPEPSTVLLLALGLVMVPWVIR